MPLAPSIRVIPKDAGVDIDGVGIRYADDSGSKIIGFHVDNFLGEVQAVVTTWSKVGVNGTQRRIKFLGY
jgi:3D (Asp-Asp-Asp) domain-containing protein